MPPTFLAYLCSQSIMDALPSAIITPLPEVMVHAFPFWILSGEHPPLDPACYQIEDCIDDHAHIDCARPSSSFRRWYQFFGKIPLAVGHVAWVELFGVHTTNFPKLLADSQDFSDSFLDQNR